jgi:hypothetical protein
MSEPAEVLHEARRKHAKWLQRFEGAYELHDDEVILADSSAQAVYGASFINLVPKLCKAIEQIADDNRHLAREKYEYDGNWTTAVNELEQLRGAHDDLLSIAKTVEPIVREHGHPVTHDFLLAAIRKAECKAEGGAVQRT